MMVVAISVELKLPLEQVKLWKRNKIKEQYCAMKAYNEIIKENGN